MKLASYNSDISNRNSGFYLTTVVGAASGVFSIKDPEHPEIATSHLDIHISKPIHEDLEDYFMDISDDYINITSHFYITDIEEDYVITDKVDVVFAIRDAYFEALNKAISDGLIVREVLHEDPSNKVKFIGTLKGYKVVYNEDMHILAVFPDRWIEDHNGVNRCSFRDSRAAERYFGIKVVPNTYEERKGEK